MLTSTGRLLASLDPLPHRGRMTALADWARTAADRAEVCADLRAGDAYERSLALTAAVVAGDRDAVDAALGDPQASIRMTAWPAALRTGRLPDTDLDLPAVERRRIYRSLRKLRLPAIADALLPRVRDLYGDDEAAVLLPACGAGTIRALLPELDHAVNLGGLARRHPGPLLDHVTARLAAAGPAERDQIWARAGHAVLRGDPARVLDLLERHPPGSDLPGDLTAYGVLAAHDPGRVARLLSDPRWAGSLRWTTVPPAVLRRLAGLPAAELVPLGRRLRENAVAWAALLGELPPSRRGELYDLTLADTDTTAAVPEPVIMEVLPAEVRIREARKVLARGHEAEVLRWSSYLAWPDARTVLTGALRSGDAQERARVYPLLIAAARRERDPEAVAEVVDRLDRLRNEQDPVRAAALIALARVARLLTPATAPGLTRLTTDAVQARDASASTLAALRKLAVDVLRAGAAELSEWALLTIRQVETPALGRFGRMLRRGQETTVYDRLRDWIESDMARGRYGPLFAVTRALGRRAWLLPGLQANLRRAITTAAADDVIRTAADLWLDDPRTRDDRVAEVLAADPSLVTVDRVWATLCRTRTDLLDLVLRRAPRGRFTQAGVRWVPSRAPYAERWTPRQRAAFVALHERIIDDPGATSRERARSIAAVAPVAGAVVRRFTEDPDVVVAEAALGALIWTDRPDEALSVLLGHADDDRARVALYAAGRAAGHVPPSRLPALLGGVLFGSAKVTSRKEAARLLARYGPPQSMRTLLEAYSAPEQHRDVRAAIAGAARGRLWDPVSWEVLAAAVHGSREESRAVLTAQPARVAHKARYAELVVAACRDTDREVARAAFDALPAWAPWAGDTTGLIADRLTDLGEHPMVFAVAALIGALPSGSPGLDTALRRLAEADAADTDEGGPARDRPARRRIELLAEATVMWSRGRLPEADREPAVAAARRLPYSGAGLTMLVGLGGLEHLAELADRCAGRPVLAVRTAGRLEDRMEELRDRLDPSTIRETASELAGRGDLAGGLFAVALARRGVDHGWAVSWRDLLRDLRRHPDEEVRAEAYRVNMS